MPGPAQLLGPRLRRAALGLVFCAPWLIAADAPAVAAVDALRGAPPVTLHRPDLPVYPQNFAVTSDDDGVVWVGNTEGVLEFDGENWRLWPLPNREIVRSLAVDGAGRVLVGGYNSFGVLERDATGSMRFRALDPLFAKPLDGREFADIWDIEVAPECVYFKALRDLFCWRPEDDSVRHWHHAGRLGAIARIGEHTWLQFRGEGLRRREGEDWVPLAGTAALDQLLFALLPLADGSVLAHGVEAQWWRIDPRQGTLRAQPMPPSLPPPSQLQHALLHPEGTLFFAAADGSLHEVAADLGSASRISLGSGFLAGIAVHAGGGLLVVSDAGVHHLRWPGAWSVLGHEHGLRGSLRDAIVWQERLWLLGSAGVQALQVGVDGTPRADAPRWNDSGVYALWPLGADRVVLAHSRRLDLRRGEQATTLSDLLYPRLLQPARSTPEVLWVGSESGLFRLDTGVDPPRLSASTHPDLAARIDSLVETADGQMVAGSSRHGLWSLAFAADGTVAKAERVDQAWGVGMGSIASARVYPDGESGLLVASTAGFWRGRPGALVRDELGGLENRRRSDELLQLLIVDGAPRWAFGHDRLFERSADGWREHASAMLRRGAIQGLRRLDDGRLLVLSDNALLVHSPQAGGVVPAVPRVRLRSVQSIDESGARTPLPLEPSAPVRVRSSDGGVSFSFALAELDAPGTARYRGRLVGEEPEFSEWASPTSYTYFGLGPGSYRMLIEAQDSAGRVSAIAPYALVVTPRWYESASFRLLLGAAALVLAALVAVLYARLRMLRVLRHSAALEREVVQRTRELSEANRRLQTVADLDGLTGLANRRRLDEYLQTVWQQCAERHRPVSVLLADVDHFKQFNDRSGHLAGDALLQRVAELLRDGLRRGEDLAARFGGEEFLVVLPGAPLEVAAEIAEGLCRKAADQLGGTTLSIGVACSAAQGGDGIRQLLDRADAALYRAKALGRNRVELAGAD